MDPAPGDVFLFLILGLVPFFLCIANLIFSIKNIKRKKTVFAYLDTSLYHGRGSPHCFGSFSFPWLGVVAIVH
jgi:hypothetical protein